MLGDDIQQAFVASSSHLNTLYKESGRPSIGPEKLIRALLLRAHNSIRPARQMMGQLNDNLLFRWFVELNRATRSKI